MPCKIGGDQRRNRGKLRKTRQHFQRNARKLRKRRPKQNPKPPQPRPCNHSAKTMQPPRNQNATGAFCKAKNYPISSNARFFSSNRPRGYNTVRVKFKTRRERDSNPRTLASQRFSRPPRSTTLPPLLEIFSAAHFTAPRLKSKHIYLCGLFMGPVGIEPTTKRL